MCLARHRGTTTACLARRRGATVVPAPRPVRRDRHSRGRDFRVFCAARRCERSRTPHVRALPRRARACRLAPARGARRTLATRTFALRTRAASTRSRSTSLRPRSATTTHASCSARASRGLSGLHMAACSSPRMMARCLAARRTRRPTEPASRVSSHANVACPMQRSGWPRSAHDGVRSSFSPSQHALCARRPRRARRARARPLTGARRGARARGGLSGCPTVRRAQVFT